jgi:hypothetical protein
MPAKKKTKKQKAKKQVKSRKCSVCGKRGHNRRTCSG